MRCGASRQERWRGLEQREQRMREERMQRACWRQLMQLTQQPEELMLEPAGGAADVCLTRHREWAALTVESEAASVRR